jgi:hypothetical protein
MSTLFELAGGAFRPRVSRRDRKHPQHPAKHTAHNPPAKLIPLIHPVHLKATCFSAALSYRAIPPPCIFSDHFLLTCPLIPTLGLICSIKVEVKKKHSSISGNFSCFADHLTEQDLF